MDENKFQAEVLKPVFNALRAELGREHAARLVLNALRKWSRERWHRLGERFPGSPKEKVDAIYAWASPRIGNDADFQPIKNEPDEQAVNITGCRYADFFLQLGEPELGVVLCCEDDFHIVEVGSPEVELIRTQTIMEGSNYCDFHFYRKSKSP